MPGKVLIADPNLDSCTQLENILREQDYEVDKVNSGNLVLTKVCEFQPHILILSVMMPGIISYDVCSAIKNDPDLKDTAIILTFSENEPFDYQQARRAGATRYLPKSVEPTLLVSILNFIWSGVAPMKYSSPLSDNDNYIVQTAELREEETIEEDLPEIDMGVELEPLDDIEVYDDLYDIDEEVIETVEVENDSDIIYQFEVDDEPQTIEEIEITPEPPLELNIDAQNQEIELTGLGLPSTTARPKSIETTDTIESSDSLGQVFEPPIVGEHFEYNTEDIEDPLQVKHQLNSIVCHECGAYVLTEDVFCIECGAAVDETAVRVPEDLSCNSCGQMVNLGDIFCLNCGNVQ